MSLALTAVAFLLIGSSIFLSTFYLSVYYDLGGRESEEVEEWPGISILMPAYNEENVVEHTVERALDLDYPNYRVYFIDDGSTDETLDRAREFEDDKLNIIAKEKNAGKAAALNTALEQVEDDYSVVLDADSAITGEVLKKAVAKMNADKDLGGVICSIMPLNRNSFFRRLQVVEYRLTNFYRSLMSRINTLDVTPGAFSLYRTADMRATGGFDEGNITEDLEMAWSLRKLGKEIGMVYEKRTHTELPENLRELYDQRVRWSRGFMYNAVKHRDMFLNKKYGWFGLFQLPLQATFPLIAIAGLIMVVSGVGEMIYNSLLTFSSAGFMMPDPAMWNLQRMFLNLNLKIYLPLVSSLVIVASVMKKAYSEAGEDVQHPIALTAYFFAYFIAKASFWTAAILKELFRTKRIWT